MSTGIPTKSRTVYTLADQVKPAPNRYTPWGLDQGDVRRVLEKLEVGGIDVTDVQQRFEDAIDRAQAAVTPPQLDGLDLLSLDADAIADIIHRAAQNASGSHFIPAVHSQVTDAIARQTAEALAPKLDDFVAAMRRDFDKHAKVIVEAHKAGVASDATAESIVADGSAKVVAAFRALPEATAALDQIASVRTELTRVFNCGPTEWEVAAFITAPANRAELEGAHNRFTGETETVQYNAPFVGSSLIDVNKPRLGGAWLSLIEGGHTLRLNTGAEADTVVSSAFKAA